MTPHGPTANSFISQRLRLHYVDWGNPDAPPLILLHGGQDHCRNWDWVAEDLRRDHHIIAPDLRGHGGSSHPTEESAYSFDAFASDVLGLLDARTVVGRFLKSSAVDGDYVPVLIP